MAAPKRTKTEREEALADVAALDRRGFSQREIAKRLGVSHQQVGYDLATIRKRYAATTLSESASAQAEKIEQLREVRAQAWEEWERSKQNKKRDKTTQKGIKFDAGGKPLDPEEVNVEEATEGRLGDPRYLEIIRKTLRDEAEIYLAAGQLAQAASLIAAMEEHNRLMQQQVEVKALPPKILPSPEIAEGG